MKEKQTEQRDVTAEKNRKRVSFLGDSYTTYGGFVYPENNRCFYNGESKDEDTESVKDTWWYQLIESKGYLLEYNNSYSGSTVCNTGYDGGDASGFSFVRRMNNIGRPDILFVMGGTNDSWANSPIGAFQYSGWTAEDLKSFRPAFAYMMEYLLLHNPCAEIYHITNSGLSAEITGSIAEICEKYGIRNIVLPDFEKPYGNHPGKAGQSVIFKTVLSAIE